MFFFLCKWNTSTRALRILYEARNRDRTRPIVVHTCYWHCPNFARRRGIARMRCALYTAEHFYESRATVYECTRRPGSGIIEIQRWSGKYTLAPRARGNKWLTLATSERKRSRRWRGKKKGTEFKHIRERRCLKNNHGARKRGGRRGARGARESGEVGRGRRLGQ